MRRAPACSPCVLGDLDAALGLLQVDPAKRLAISGQARAELEASWAQNRIPGEHITEAHRLLKRSLGLLHPFEQARTRANEVGMALAQEIATRPPGEAGARLRYFVRWAIAGNLLDFRVCGYDLGTDEARARLQAVFDEGLAIDHVDRLLAHLGGAQRILFVHDNVGEIAFDKVLLADLRGLCGQRVQLWSALRRGVMTSDATLEDGEAVGLAEVSEIIESGPDTLGINFAEMTDTMRAAIAQADLIIAKGQANFYVFDDRPREVRCPVLCLLRTKCMVVSNHLGFDRIVNVAKWLGA